MRLTRHSSLVYFAGLAVLLCAVEAWIVASVWFPLNADVLSLIITADLTLGIPGLYYLLLVRPRRSPAITLAPVFIASVVLANVILPSAQHAYLDRVELILPLIEGAVLLFVAFKARLVVRHYQSARATSTYTTDALETSLRRTFGSSPVIGLLVTELTLPYYVVCGWFKRFRPSDPVHIALSYHRKNGYGAVVGMFASVIVIETIGLHLVIQHWNATVAWLITALSLYSLVWIVGDYHAARLHPLVLSEQQLHIRAGLRWRIDVAWTHIAALHRASPHQKHRRDYVNAAIYGEPQVVLELSEPVVAHGLFGIRRQVRWIGLSVDDEQRLRRELGKRVQH